MLKCYYCNSDSVKGEICPSCKQIGRHTSNKIKVLNWMYVYKGIGGTVLFHAHSQGEWFTCKEFVCLTCKERCPSSLELALKLKIY